MVARFCKELYPFCRAGAVDFFTDVCLPFLTNWLNVGILFTSCDIVCWLLSFSTIRTKIRTKKYDVFYARHIIISVLPYRVKDNLRFFTWINRIFNKYRASPDPCPVGRYPVILITPLFCLFIVPVSCCLLCLLQVIPLPVRVRIPAAD